MSKVALVIAAGLLQGVTVLAAPPEESPDQKAARELKQGRPFEALLELGGSGDDRLIHFEALSQLGACDWALGDLEREQAWCRERPHEGCTLLRKIEPEVLRACPRDTQQGDDDRDADLTERLKAPRIVAFEERRVPKAERWVGERPEEAPSTKAYPALADVTIVALSPEAERMFAVSVSEDVDPRGEVSAGGYWLHLSDDRGKTWAGPYYLGFAAQFPYVVLAASHVPAFDGDRLDVEVERREVDERTITFPPVGLRAKKVEKNLYLSIDVAAVERDSDGDGLTDLLEEKLVLDPLSADTDGDGIPDGSDPLPLQARSEAESSETTELLKAVLPSLFGGLSPVQQSAADGAEGSPMSLQTRRFASARTLFITGADVLLPHDAGVRAVLFRPNILKEYRRKFGATYPMDLPDIAFNRDRQRALIRYSFGWTGGSLLAERKAGRWVITPRGSWIT